MSDSNPDPFAEAIFGHKPTDEESQMLKFLYMYAFRGDDPTQLIITFMRSDGIYEGWIFSTPVPAPYDPNEGWADNQKDISRRGIVPSGHNNHHI